MKPFGRAASRCAGQTLAASLVVIAILAILAIVVIQGTGGSGKSSRADGRGTTRLGMVKARAEDTVCVQTLQQVRQGIAVYQTTDDSFPPTLQDTRLGQRFYECPMGKEPYEYNSETGKVSCKHPGHEKY